MSAHSADFVWWAAGAVATHTAAGGEALVLALSYDKDIRQVEAFQRPVPNVVGSL